MLRVLSQKKKKIHAYTFYGFIMTHQHLLPDDSNKKKKEIMD